VAGEIDLAVNAVYEVDILSAPGATETWSVPEKATVNFTQHTKGITINFVNKFAGATETDTYCIHSSATAFQHQTIGGNTPGSANAGLGVAGQSTNPSYTQAATSTALAAVTAGDTYTVTVTSQTPKLTNLVYDHENENPGNGRNFVFNAFTAPPVIGKSGNPNASFAYIQKNVFAVACMSCHITNPSTMGGGVNLSNYTDVLTQVQPGSALGSALYVQVAPGGSMPEGDPGSLASDLVQDIEDWINDGALDN
jgi:hypothetical protein